MLNCGFTTKPCTEKCKYYKTCTRNPYTKVRQRNSVLPETTAEIKEKRANILMSIYQKLDIDGSLREPLTTEEMVVLYGTARDYKEK